MIKYDRNDGTSCHIYEIYIELDIILSFWTAEIMISRRGHVSNAQYVTESN